MSPDDRHFYRVRQRPVPAWKDPALALHRPCSTPGGIPATTLAPMEEEGSPSLDLSAERPWQFGCVTMLVIIASLGAH